MRKRIDRIKGASVVYAGPTIYRGMPMKAKEALKICYDKLQFVANTHGGKWKEESQFLLACKEALVNAVMSEPKDPMEGLPLHDGEVLGTIIVYGTAKTSKGVARTVEHRHAILTYNPSEGWETIPHITEDFEVKKWSEIPKW